MIKASISKQTLKRLPMYLSYLKSLPGGGPSNISATSIAEGLNLNDVQVRKDLAAVSSGGRPKIGYVTEELIADIECFLYFDDTDSAIIVGAGNLGRALLNYEGFSDYGLNILAAFDIDESLCGATPHGKKILPLSKMSALCERLKIGIGIIAVPSASAQEVCDMLTDKGVKAIWNFSPTFLRVPEGVLVQNENIAASLAVLSKHLAHRMNDTASAVR
ncbi:MAG: redox-sensing transcriptional repressor Rex [Christensenellales bacterium]|jgi:redox-sensing transcriptional repressor